MNNSDFNIYDDNEQPINKLAFNKRLLIAVALVVILGLLFLLYLHNNDTKINNYSLTSQSDVNIYMGEILNLPVELNGNNKYLDRIKTVAFSKNNIVNIDDTGFYGQYGFIIMDPVSVGEDEITIVSTITKGKNTEQVAKSTVNLVVCPMFNESLLKQSSIQLKIGERKSIDLKFNSLKCYEEIDYESSNPNILSVTETGIITGLKAGTAELTISNGNNVFTTPVRVISK